MKRVEGWFGRRATTWLAVGLGAALRHYELLRGCRTSDSSTPALLSFMIRVAKDAARDAVSKLDDELRAVWRCDLKNAEGRAGLKYDALEKRIARLEQFHCKHEFSEAGKGCLESLLCAKCGAVNPEWRKIELPVESPSCDWVEWENSSQGWRPRDKRAIYVKENGYYVPTTPPKEAP